METTSDADADTDNEIITIKTGGGQRTKNTTKTPWVKHGKSKQDQISSDPALMQEKLDGFEQILPHEYVIMENGTFIRYVCYANGKPQLRLGGYLIKNSAPDFWILKSGGHAGRSVTWSVALKPVKGKPANVYYRRKGVRYGKEEKIRYGAEVFESLESGKYILVATDRFETIVGHPVAGKEAPKKPKKSTRAVEMTENSRENSDDDDISEVRRPTLQARFK